MNSILVALTQSAWFAAIMAFLASEGVPIATWVGQRHPGLAWTQYLALALSVFDSFATQLEASLFLQTATGKGLVKFARSQYQLELFPAEAQLARFVLTSAAGAPTHTVSAGDVIVGQVGGALEWTNAEDFEIQSGRIAIVLFRATASGSSHNVSNNQLLELKTTLLGVTVTNPATGKATAVGAGAAGLYCYAAQAGVTLRIIDPGLPSQALTVNGNLGTKLITVSLQTDGASALVSTADQVREALVTAVTATGVPQLLKWAKNITTGANAMAATTSDIALDWIGSYIETPGAEEEATSPALTCSLARRCLLRFMTLGGWAGDGAPPAPVSTDEAMEYWARAKPAGYKRSPVTGVRVFSNFLSGSPSGKDITILIWGVVGALAGADVVAVIDNFFNGRKFSIGSDLTLLTVTNVNTGLGGTVTVSLASGYTEAEVRAALAARMAQYQQTASAVFPGMTLEPSILSARLADALPDGAILSVNLTVPPFPTVFAWNQYPLIDTSPLSIAFA